MRASAVVARGWDLPRPGVEPTPTALPLRVDFIHRVEFGDLPVSV